jgi:hypothetical protein
VFWNPRGIVNKATEFKRFLEDKGEVYPEYAKWNWEEARKLAHRKWGARRKRHWGVYEQ